MRIIKISGVLAGIFFSVISFAQRLTPEQYVLQYKDLAIREMKRMGVPAAITLAQGLLETENGNSELLKKSNNHFGIKCKSNWTAAGVSHDDDAPGECFRTYKDAEGSYRDHSNYLRGTERYGFLFALKPTDYKGWAYGLRKAGYATNPKYPEILIKNIEQFNLQQYTMEGLGEMPKYEPGKYADDPVVPIKNGNQENIEKPSDANIVAPVDESGSINGAKYQWYEQGKSLLAIATEKNINLNKLLEYNDLEKDGLLVKDQIIFLQKKSVKGDKDFDVVRPGETLYEIAQRNGVQLKYLQDYNSVHSGLLPVGTKIKLRPEAKNDISTPEMHSTGKTIHEVGAKEGLYSISKKYGVSMQQIREWNHLSSDELKIGQQLIVAQ